MQKNSSFFFKLSSEELDRMRKLAASKGKTVAALLRELVDREARATARREART